MRENLVKTEEFKDSLVGRIPKDWDVSSLAALTQYITYGFTNPMPTTKDGPWMITAFDIANGKICYGQARHTSEKAYKNDLTQKSKPNLGDILITKDGTLGRIAVVDRTGICINQSVACLRPLLDTDVRFLVHYLRSDIGQERMLADAGGSTIKHLYITKLAQMEVPVPPREERTRISDILDTIDSTIAHTSSLLAKLKQMKAGLLHDLLTRGLDENGELRDAIGHPQQFKDSPLGQIPKNWKFTEFGALIAEGPQNGIYKPESDYADNGLPIVRIDGFYDGVLANQESFRRVRLTEAEIRRYALNKEDILINRVNSIDFVGKSAIVLGITEATVFESNIMRLLLKRELILPAYAIRLICFFMQRQLRSQAKSAIAQASINQYDVRSCIVAIPSVEEQAQIVERIDTLDSRIRTEEAYRDKLKLQKQGLMHDLLTGKVRVKDVDKFTPASDTV
jgi:type I restriction enzyme S subunit